MKRLTIALLAIVLLTIPAVSLAGSAFSFGFAGGSYGSAFNVGYTNVNHGTGGYNRCGMTIRRGHGYHRPVHVQPVRYRPVNGYGHIHRQQGRRYVNDRPFAPVHVVQSGSSYYEYNSSTTTYYGH